MSRLASDVEHWPQTPAIAAIVRMLQCCRVRRGLSCECHQACTRGRPRTTRQIALDHGQPLTVAFAPRDYLHAPQRHGNLFILFSVNPDEHERARRTARTLVSLKLIRRTKLAPRMAQHYLWSYSHLHLCS